MRANDIQARSGNDSVYGGDGNDYLQGEGGDDSLMGDADQDTLIGGAGNDTLDGGAQRNLDGGSVRANWALTENQGTQVDIALYTDATSAVTVMLGADGTNGSATGGGIGTDVLIDIEMVIGSAYHDVIHGSNRAVTELFRGGAGNDTLQGGSGTGVDLGLNYVDYRSGAGAVTVNLATGSASGADGNDVLSGFQGIITGNFNDALTGDGLDNYLEAGGGNDTMDGGAGWDVLSYTNATGGVTVNMATGTASGAAGNDSFTGIEALRGSEFSDTLTGGEVNDEIQGRAGNDSIDGGAGNDSLQGGDGADSLRGGTGSDLLDGGAQRIVVGATNDENWRLSANQSSQYDLVDYTDAASGVSVMLGADGTAGSASGGGVGNDVLSNIEMVLGSPYGDVIHGSDRSVNEIFRGGAGDDTIQGGSGAGTDLGSNFVDYRSGAGSVTVNLATNSASGADGNDVITGVRGIISGDFNDLLTGDAQDNYFDGGGGNDTIDGGDGNDALSFNNATGGVTASLATNTSSGAGGIDTFTSIERLRGSEYADTLTGGNGNDSIQGRAGNDSIDGSEGNDELHGGYGNDSIDGGAGTDTALYAGPRSSYVITWTGAAFTVSGADEGTDTLANIEQVQFADQTVETVRPAVLGYSPADAATGVAIGANITVTFSEPIQSGSGTIVLTTTAGALVASYPSTSPNLAFSGSTLTLNPTANLQPYTSYTVEIAAGSIQDLAGNPYAGTTSYDFTTGPRLTVGDALVSVYTGMYNRAPDQEGLSFWQQDVQNKFGLQSDSAVTDLAFQRAMVQAFAQFPTYYVLYKDMSDESFVSQLYVNLQNRTGDAGGQAYWLGRLDGSVDGEGDGPDSREKITADFIYGTLSADYGSDAFVNNFDPQTLAAAQAAQDAARNKIEVAKYYTQVFGELSNYGDIVGSGYFNPNPASPTYEADARALQAWLETQPPYANSTESISGVTSDSATVATSKALVDALYEDAAGGAPMAVSLVGVVEG